MEAKIEKNKEERKLVRKCHLCGHVHEAPKEIERCMNCHKSFLPLNYFEKIHHIKHNEYQTHFVAADELEQEDLIQGLFVLW